MVIGPTLAVQSFLNHWRSLPKEGFVPSLQEFLNHPAPDLQPHVILLDVVSDVEINVRLMGTGLVALTGRELTRTNSLDIYAPHLRKRVGHACVTMVTQPCGQITERLLNTAGSVVVGATSIGLPLLVKGGLLGCIAAYTNPREPVAAAETNIIISDILATEWVDIGAGVPARR